MLLISSSLTAQDYIPMLQDGNKWGTQYCFFGECEGIYITQIIGEEIVNGKVYKALKNETCLLREENGVVYILNDDQSEDVYLDFTLEIGDSLFKEDLFDNCLVLDTSEDIDEIRIVDVQSQFILGEDRKVLYTAYYHDGVQFDLGGEEEIWIEGIGSTAGIGPGGIIFDLEVRLRCFTNNGETIKVDGHEITETDDACEETTAGVDEFDLSQISITPNPAHDKATLSLPLPINNARIKIFDINGRVFYEAPISAKSTPLDVSLLRSGLYFYQIYSKNQLLITKKLLVS